MRDSKFRQMNYRILKRVKKEAILTIAITLAIISSFFERPKWSYINVEVLILLFNLMLIIVAFKTHHVLDYCATKLLNRCKTYRQTGYFLVGLTFVAAMFMTNDVALITFVPLTLIIGKMLQEPVLKWVVFQTLAANLGSSLTPMGNPQNLFIYKQYGMGLIAFTQMTLGMTLIAVVFLGCLLYKAPKKPVTYHMQDVVIKEKKKVVGFVILFMMVLGSVIGIIDYRIIFMVIIIYALITERRLFRQVDYSLLITFIGFFIFVGNLAAMPQIKNCFEIVLKHSGATYLSGILLSQIISNVPATMLLAPFTTNWRELLLGVDIGGMGTLIASMASIISYKLYIEEYPQEQKQYLKVFTDYNLLGLAIFVPVVAVFLWMIK